MSTRDPACADDGPNRGCYMFAPGSPEKAACRAACQLRERTPAASLWFTPASLLPDAPSRETLLAALRPHVDELCRLADEERERLCAPFLHPTGGHDAE